MKRDNPNGSDDRARHAAAIVSLLRREYPSAATALNYATPLELLVATILSAQCTDRKVNEVTLPLFKKYRTAKDFARAALPELEQEIRQTGFFRNKSRNIIAAADRLCRHYGGEVPDSMQELVTLPGVARKTANIVLSGAFHKAEGIAVDVHVKRLSNRLGLSRQNNPDKIERDLMAIVPRRDWIIFNYLLVDHGRNICKARRPRCRACVLNTICPSAEPADLQEA